MTARLAGNLGTRGLEAWSGSGFSLGEMRNAWSAPHGGVGSSDLHPEDVSG